MFLAQLAKAVTMPSRASWIGNFARILSGTSRSDPCVSRGTITDTDVEKAANGKCYWSIDVKPTKGVEKEIHIDGQTGAPF